MATAGKKVKTTLQEEEQRAPQCDGGVNKRARSFVKGEWLGCGTGVSRIRFQDEKKSLLAGAAAQKESAVIRGSEGQTGRHPLASLHPPRGGGREGHLGKAVYRHGTLRFRAGRRKSHGCERQGDTGNENTGGACDGIPDEYALEMFIVTTFER